MGVTGVGGPVSRPTGEDHEGGGGGGYDERGLAGGAASPLPTGPPGLPGAPGVDAAVSTGVTGVSGGPAADPGPGCSVSSLMWLLLKGDGSVRPLKGGWRISIRPAAPAVCGRRRPCYGMTIGARHRVRGLGEVACPPHVTPDRHRVDEPDGRGVMDMARRRRAPAQGHRRRGPGASRRSRRCGVAGGRRRRARRHRDLVADCHEARPFTGEDRRTHRGPGHAQAGARRLGHPGPRIGQAAS